MVINKDGRISTLRIATPSDTKLDDEIARVVKGLPKLEPGIRNDNPVNVKYNVLIKLDNDELKIKSH